MAAATVPPPLALRKKAAFAVGLTEGAAADDDPVPTYTLGVAACACDPSIAAVSGSDYCVKIYDRQALTVRARLAGHHMPVVGLSFCDTNPNLLWTCSQDRNVLGWDLRCDPGAPATRTLHVSQTGEPAGFDVNHGASCLAVGTEFAGDDASVILADPRVPGQPMAVLPDLHSNDVTQVRFGTASDSLLVTGGEDGLVNAIDVARVTAADPDDALLHTLNADASLTSIGFFGPADRFVFGITRSETLYVWHALPRDGTDASEQLASFQNIREQAVQQGFSVDYFVDCAYDPGTQRLYTVTGSYSGKLEVFHVNQSLLSPAVTLDGGHMDVVRFAQWDFQSNTLLTGGEDSMLCLWGPQPSGAEEDARLAKVVHRHTKTARKSAVPY
eukprot:m.289563 g.289563  ORF g.289563 m.289563 type:complete len:386 (-) comp19460_c0_seq17:98-1255(-)